MKLRERLRPFFRHWATKETLACLKLAWPIGVSFFLQQTIITVSLAFSGHIQGDSTILLEAVGLSVSTISVTGLTLGVGLCAAIDTLASQAWGAKNYKKIGIYVQRSVLILGLAMLLICSFWFNIESILHLIHQPPCVIDYTVQYIQVAMLALPAIFLYTILQRYLQAQNIVYPFIITGLCANILNALAHYLFLFVAKWGVQGAAGAVVLSWYTLLISLLIIIYVRKLHVKTWGGWSRECLNDWGQFARFGIPGFVMLFAEWGGFELGFILTGIVDGTQQTIYTVVANLVNFLYMIPLSIAIAASIRIGNEIGAGEPKKAKKAFFVGLCITEAWVAFITTINLSLKSYIPLVFTASEYTLSLLGAPMIATAVFIAIDHTDALLGGVLRGLGKQGIGAASNSVAFWVVGIPLGIGLVFGVKLGALGYMIGLIVAAFSQLVAYVVVIVATNWQKESEKARKIAEAKTSPAEEHVTSDNVVSEDEMPLKPWSDNEDDVVDNRSPPPVAIIEPSCNGHTSTAYSDNDNAGTCDSEPIVNSFSSNAEKTELSSSVHSNGDLHEGGTVTESEFDSDSEPLVTTSVQCPETEGENSQRQLSKAPVTKKTVLIRILTVSAFVIFLLIGFVFSQLYVYRPNVCVQSNSTNTSTNSTINFPYDNTTLSSI